MDTMYQISTPDGTGDNSYSVINDGNLAAVLAFTDEAKDNVSVSFTLTVDPNDSNVGYLVSRSDPNTQFRYDDFTPSSNDLAVDKYTFYYPEDQDFMTHVQAQNPEVDFDAHPELIPDFCMVEELEQYYSFDIPSV